MIMDKDTHMADIIYTTTVHTIGAEAKTFAEEGMAVLFGEEAPPELREYCYLVERSALRGRIQPGAVMVIGTERLPITAVGQVAEKNLADLGHVTINGDAATVAKLEGTVHVRSADGTLPEILEGTQIRIEA